MKFRIKEVLTKKKITPIFNTQNKFSVEKIIYFFFSWNLESEKIVKEKLKTWFTSGVLMKIAQKVDFFKDFDTF